MWISGNSRCCIPKTPVGNLLWLFKARFRKGFCSHIGSIIWTLWPIYGQLITSGHQEPRGVVIHSY
jgi:hypothetical protein